MNKLNKLIFSWCIFILTTSLFSQGAEHKIVEILPNENVRINIGQDSGVKTGDYFQVFGKSEVIHPATGQLIVKENVYIGKLEVIEVDKTESVCKVLEQKKYFQISDKVRKVSKGVDSVIQEERDTQFEFESPQKRDYAETIYSKKPDPTRDISAKKLWFEGPFLLEKGMVKFSIPFKHKLKLWDENDYWTSQIVTHLKIKYGLFKNFQIGGLIPIKIKWEDYEEAFGAGLSDIKIEGQYSIDINNYTKNIELQNLNFSTGIIYTIATDDGWLKYNYFGNDVKLPTSNGYNTLSLMGLFGLKRKSMYAFAEYKYNINGKRTDSEQGWSYNPSNNSELNFIGSFFISERTKLRSEINILNNYSPVDIDGDSDKRGMIILKPSIHKLMTETFIWSFEFFFPLKNEYDYDYYFGLTMGFTWIN